MSLPENPTLETTRIGKVINKVENTFKEYFPELYPNTSKILGGNSCDNENVNMLVCRFTLSTPKKLIVDESYIEMQNNLLKFSKLTGEEFKVEDLRVETETLSNEQKIRVIFYVRCTF